MGLKTLYADMDIYNENIAKYLAIKKVETPTKDGSSICHYTKDGPVLVEPSEDLQIALILDDKNPIFRDLEKLVKGEKLNE